MCNMADCHEIRGMYLYAEYFGYQDDFAVFLRYCAERLEQGASVQEIWSEWQEISA